jgi:ribosomal protein L1
VTLVAAKESARVLQRLDRFCAERSVKGIASVVAVLRRSIETRRRTETVHYDFGADAMHTRNLIQRCRSLAREIIQACEKMALSHG